MAGCYDENKYYYSGHDFFNQLSRDNSPDSVSADGNSYITFTYKLPVEVDTSLTELNLKTTNGTFFETGKASIKTNFSNLDTTGDSLYAEVTLVSSTKASLSIVTTSLQGYSVKDTVKFYKAFPSDITLSIIPFYIKNDLISEVLITCTLSSDDGIASEKNPIFLDFSPSIGILDTKISYSDSIGKARFNYVFNDLTYVGNIEFTAKTFNEDDVTILESAKLIIIE